MIKMVCYNYLLLATMLITSININAQNYYYWDDSSISTVEVSANIVKPNDSTMYSLIKAFIAHEKWNEKKESFLMRIPKNTCIIVSDIVRNENGIFFYLEHTFENNVLKSLVDENRKYGIMEVDGMNIIIEGEYELLFSDTFSKMRIQYRDVIVPIMLDLGSASFRYYKKQFYYIQNNNGQKDDFLDFYILKNDVKNEK